jgi:Protein tyrosine and serine/threonine kinase
VDKTNEGYYTCQAKTEEGAKAKTGRLMVSDGWPRTKRNWTIVLGVFDGLALAVITIVIFKVWYDRQKRNLKQWMKKVIVVEFVEKDGKVIMKIENERTCCSAVCQFQKVPEVRLISVKTKGEIVGDGYAYPDDEQYEVARENITLGNILGAGNFGCVYQAEVRDLFAAGISTIAAVKMLKDGYSDKDVMDLYNEKEVMKTIPKHENVINLLGCCSSPDGPLLVIVECALNGSLIDYLKDLRKPNSDGAVPPKSPQEIDLLIKQFLKFSYQIANGMEHLASVKCVHRDLAARNVLIDISYNMKISDFGLARDINRSEYYRRNADAELPIHWMAPEALTDGKYDLCSDVYETS